MLNIWYFIYKVLDECEDSWIWYGEKLYICIKYYSCNLYRIFIFFIYYLVFLFLLKLYNF